VLFRTHFTLLRLRQAVTASFYHSFVDLAPSAIAL
jgi:hypothetical protein